jgi:hypothetical protein
MQCIAGLMMRHACEVATPLHLLLREEDGEEVVVESRGWSGEGGGWSFSVQMNNNCLG